MRGHPREGARLDLIETLRAAAPWQPLRRTAARAGDERVLVRADDFRVKRSKMRAEKVVIFVVDASGSTALARLAEAKGAIELMLGQAYVARQQVALIAFRGNGAELLLPPTRSLVMTKRRLAQLPGGGGTPLAAGLAEALALARQARLRGVTPYVALLTDGRANIALDGTPGRPQAGEDAERMARLYRSEGLPAAVIDTATRPSQPARDLAAAMGASYLALPRADARALSGALGAALAGAA
jgi:magnesium chelatase subunit D